MKVKAQLIKYYHFGLNDFDLMSYDEFIGYYEKIGELESERSTDHRTKVEANFVKVAERVDRQKNYVL